MSLHSKMCRPVLMVASISACSSCTLPLASFHAISTREVQIEGRDLSQLPGPRVKGRSSRFLFLFIPFGLPHLDEAVDDALDQGGGDLLVDAVATTNDWWFLVGMQTVQIEGKVVNTKGAK